MTKYKLRQHKNIFEECPKCSRPYKKTDKFPDEVCHVCEQEPTQEDLIKEDLKEEINN